MGYRVVVAGATGNVGREMLNILAERQFPVDEIAVLASRKSMGTECSFGDKTVKTEDLDTFDFTAQPSLNEARVRELLRGEYMDERENVLLVGNPGTGKSHLARGAFHNFMNIAFFDLHFHIKVFNPGHP